MVHGLPDWTTPISIAGISISSLPIDIVALTLGTVAISIDAGDVTGNIAVDIKAQTVGNLGVDLKAQTMGNVAIDIAAQTMGNVEVDIKAQTVDLNIKTSGGVNIIIDKLTQTAYTERRSTISSDGVVSLWWAPTGTRRDGKFFPRGCRGFIETIDVYCYDDGAAGGTISVYLAPYPGAGYVHTADVTIPAGGAADWRSATFRKFWNKDSLFVFLLSSTSDMKVGYDATLPRDAFYTSDSGATWRPLNARYYIRAVMQGQTIGDVPVSGTLNTIPLSLAAGESVEDSKILTLGDDVVIISVDGMGYCEFFFFHAHSEADADHTFVKVYCDDVRAFSESMDTLSQLGFTASTPGVSLTAFNVDGICVAVFTTRFEFTRKFEIWGRNNISAGMATVEAIVHLIT